MTARKPPGLKILQGNARPDREPKVMGGDRLTVAPRPPARLGPAAAAEWRTLAKTFTAARLLAGTDLPLLELLAQALADEAEAKALLEREGWTIAAGSGGRKAHPAIGVRDRARATAIRLLLELGGSPRARQSVAEAPAGIGSDPAEAFLGRQWDKLKRLQAG